MSNWKKLQFFQKSEPEILEESISATVLLKGLETTCACNGMFFGDAMGQIHHIDRYFQCTLSFKAYTKRVTMLRYLPNRKILLSVGDEETAIPTLKVWNLENLSTEAPVLLRTTKITHGNKFYPVTALAHLDNLSQLAIGLENGTVILLKGDISRDRYTNAKIIYEGNEIITGLGFRDDSVDTMLFIVTSGQIRACITSTSSTVREIRMLDTVKSQIGDSIISPQNINQEMVVALPEAIYFYGPEGKGPCYIVGGEKSMVTWYKGYLLAVSKEPTVKLEGYLESQIEIPDVKDAAGTLLTVYDLKAKYIAFQDDFGKRAFDPRAAKAIGEPIKHIVVEWDSIIVITAQHKIFQLKEFDLSHKLAELFKKDYYELALDIVLQPSFTAVGLGKPKKTSDLLKSTISDPKNIAWETICQICKKYGDYYYSQQDFDSSIIQYIYTIGFLEPSYVIRKFLDAQRIHNLTSYLKALHEKNVANGDHTTLLLNCFTKLNDLEHLIEFIELSDTYDAETAIIVCRNSGYCQQSLQIASKFELHEWYVKLLVEDLDKFDEAVSYLANLTPTLFQSALLKYGHVLVHNRPKKMTKLLIGKFEILTELKFTEIVPFYVLDPDWCILFLEGLLEKKFGIRISSREGDFNLLEDRDDKKMCAEICDLLLDFYLLMKQSESDGNRDDIWSTKIVELLSFEGISYDLENALYLCKSHGFTKAELMVNEKLGLFDSSLNIFIKEKNFDAIFKLCQKYGDDNPNLWKTAIDYCAQNLNNNNNSDEKLLKILQEIENRKLQTHSETIQLLAECEGITIGMVRPFLLKIIENDLQSIEKTKENVIEYTKETEKNKDLIKEITSNKMVFQPTRCELCRQNLELPTINFYCKHSYHSKCLGDMSDECPRCGPEHHLIEEMLRSQKQSMNDSEFMDKINKNMADPYQVIIEYFSKNLF